ncbi:FAD-dependent monooxygenase [Kitasatospora azatica]|uniref:FAD-dependent monooxygenase n=1 Tax=Kitasatospora azatica TaxID=58347 RepID=UPI00068A8C8B|nr:FAD-dependent monooxygenase [Kitasatospora azatica]
MTSEHTKSGHQPRGSADGTEVLVVGAGPTGLTLAAELLKSGTEVRVVDRAERSNPHSKAITLWPRALEAFAAVGAGDAIYERGLKLRAANYYAGTKLLNRLVFRPMPGTRYPYPLSLAQSETEEFLRVALAELGGKVEYGRRVRSVQAGPDQVNAVFEDGSSVLADWLVGCDGAHSTVRAEAGIAFEGATYPQTFVLADGVYDTPLAHDESYYFMGPKGVIVVVGLPDGLLRVFGAVAPDVPVTDALATVQQIVAERSPFPLRLVEARGSGVFQVHRRIADRMRQGRILLAGDAAHIHSPAGGQGLNTSVQDSHGAAWRLAAIQRGTLPASALDSWEAERLHVARHVVADADRQTRMWSVTGWRRRRRDLSLAVTSRVPALAQRVPIGISQLRLAYPNGEPGHPVLRPGSRLPDVALNGGRWLHDHLHSGRHLLLVSATDAEPARELLARAAEAPVEVVQVDDRILRALGVRTTLACLVRPDGVIAASGTLVDPAAAERLLARLPAGRPTLNV